MTSRALVFAGAGASTAVNRERFPTTRDFFDRLPGSITKDQIFRLVDGYLRRKDPERVIDIEEILWELSKLRDFARSVQTSSDVVGYAFANNRLAQITVGANQTLPYFDTAVSGTLSMSNALSDAINAVVYELYNYEPTESELKNNWTHLFGKLRNASLQTDIFTTNYDIAIETAVSFDGKIDENDFLGLKGRVSKELHLDRWRKSDSEKFLFTKLHGSINWVWKGKSIHLGAPVFTGQHKNHAIIYPGFKGEADNEFFAPLHQYLGDRLEAANVVIFVGFAFRDEHINRLIADRIETGTRVIVINPDKTVMYPVARHKPTYIHAGFDRQSINQALSSTPEPTRQIRRI